MYALSGALIEDVIVVEECQRLDTGRIGEHLITVETVLVSLDAASHHQFEHIGEGKLNFGTEFPRFKKIKVNGQDADPLYKFLQEQAGFAGWDESHPIAPILDKMLGEADPDYKKKPDIKWNFTKFLINKKGQVVARFEPTENIENIARQIEELLK